MEKKKPVRQEAKNYLAKMNIYTSMAHYVAKVLHIRPNDILDHWGTAELVVAFGEYANQESKKNYEEWKSLESDQRSKIPKPEEYAVYFHNGDDESWKNE